MTESKSKTALTADGIAALRGLAKDGFFGWTARTNGQVQFWSAQDGEPRKHHLAFSTAADAEKFCLWLEVLSRAVSDSILSSAPALLAAAEAQTPDREWEYRFKRSQQRWGNLKARIKGEIESLSNPCLSVQQRNMYANGIARLNWVLDEMGKSPDVLAEALPLPPDAPPQET